MIDFTKIYTDFTSWLFITVIGGGSAWVIALRRKVNTNEAQIKQDRVEHQKQIELILNELVNRRGQREEDHERMGRIETDVRDIKNVLLDKRS